MPHFLLAVLYKSLGEGRSFSENATKMLYRIFWQKIDFDMVRNGFYHNL